MNRWRAESIVKDSVSSLASGKSWFWGRRGERSVGSVLDYETSERRHRQREERSDESGVVQATRCAAPRLLAVCFSLFLLRRPSSRVFLTSIKLAADFICRNRVTYWRCGVG